MSKTILDYLNNEIKLSKIVQNIEKDFQNGYLFAELLQKLGYLKKDITIFKKDAESENEIQENFKKLKEKLNEIGIHLDAGTIKSIYSCEKNISSNLIYKIKTKIFRKNIGFDDIMNKIQLHEKEEKEKNVKKNNKILQATMMKANKKVSKIQRSRSSSHFSEISNFHISSNNMPFIEPINKNKTNYNFYGKNNNNNSFNQGKLKKLISSLKNNLGLQSLKHSGSASDLLKLKNNLGYSSKNGKIDYNNNILKLNKNKIGANSKNFSPQIYLKKIIKI